MADTDGLGVLGDLATAVGLVNGDGDFQDGWLRDPGDYLRDVLSDDGQRAALLNFFDEVLGGSRRDTDADGRVWLPVVDNDPHVKFYAVVDERAEAYVAVGVGVRLVTTGPDSTSQLHVPAFRVARNGSPPVDPVFIGVPGARITASVALTFGGPPAPGEAHLGGLELAVDVPTAAGDDDATVSLGLVGLQLPGGGAPRDLRVSAADADDIDDVVLELVLGLVQAQAAAGGGQVEALARLLGLASGTAIPTLPVEDVLARGVQVLAEWFRSVAEPAPARAAWMAALADLVGAPATVVGDEVRIAAGAAEIHIGLGISTDPGGQPVVTPRLALVVADGSDVQASVRAEPFRVALGPRTAAALPSFEAFVQLGAVTGGTRLLTGDPGVGALRAGIRLDADQRPTVLLAADDVTVAGTSFATLDLTNPDAVVAAAGAVLDTVAEQVLDGLGPVGALLKQLLGVSAPSGHPTVPTIDVARLFQDPVGALRHHWATLVADHPAAITELLEVVRDLVADDAVSGTALTGSGTATDPWRVPLVGAVELRAVRDPAGALTLSVGAGFAVDDLGQRCTVVTTDVAVAVAHLDLAAGSVDFVSAVDVSLRLRARRGDEALLKFGDTMIIADHMGLVAAWTPGGGLVVGLDAPGLRLRTEGTDVALDLTDRATIERLVGFLAGLSEQVWLADVARALGWSADSSGPRLSLDALASDAQAALLGWLGDVAAEADASALADTVAGLARALAGSVDRLGSVSGTGRPDDPFLLHLEGVPGRPALAAWVEPDGPALPATVTPDILRAWRPGNPPVPVAVLADALTADASLDPAVAGLVAGRAAIADGLEAVVARLTGTDGRVLPPTTVPAGTTTHRIADRSWANLADIVDLPALLGAPPDTTVHVRSAAPDATVPFPGAPTERVVDLRQPGLAPDAFPQPTPAAGEWFVVVAPPNDADQAARLTRVLAVFDAVAGSVALVGHGGAGHAALAAANALGHVDAVVTVGTPLAPVASDVATTAPSADALRLLRALLPPPDAAEPDDADLALGRALIEGLFPIPPLQPPTTGAVTPRAGLAHHAVFGELGPTALNRALTAIVAARLAGRARTRDAAARRPAEQLRLGARLPVAVTDGDLAADGHVDLDLVGVDVTGAAPGIATGRGLTARLTLSRRGGWLVDGPDMELRRVDAQVRLPLGDGQADAVVVLHEPAAFGVRRDRWEIRAGDPLAAPALPEVRVLLSAVVEQVGALPAVADLLSGLGLLVDGGLNPDALDDLLHDPAHLVAESLTSRAALMQSAADTLLASLPGVGADLAARRITVDLAGVPGDHGMIPWSVQLVADASGAAAATVVLGSPGTTPAGGVEVRLATDPLAVAVVRHRPGLPPQTLPLWPTADSSALAALVLEAVPAEIARHALEQLRALDEDARGVVDAVLDGLGLVADGRVLLPAGFVSDPRAWLAHPAALGGGAAFDPARVAGLLDALKPVLGVAGPPGRWQLAPGVVVEATASSGALRLGLSLDNGAFTPVATAVGRLGLTVSAGLLVGTGAPRPELAVAVGVEGSGAVHLGVGADVTVVLRRDGRPDLPLYPGSPGLGDIVGAGVDFALPLVLDEVASQTGAGVAGQAGAVVRALGDALDLRPGGTFSRARLAALAADPADELVSRLSALTAAGLQALADAFDAALPSVASATVAGGELRVTVAQVTVGWRPAPFQLLLTVDVSGIDVIGSVAATLRFDAAELVELSATLGPAAIDAGVATLRPLVAAAVGTSPAAGRRVDVGLALDTTGDRTLRARWNIDSGTVDLLAVDGAVSDPDPTAVALALLDAVVDLAAGIAMQTPEVQALLGEAVGATSVRQLLAGVLLDEGDPTQLIADLFDVDTLADKLVRLVVNVAGANLSLDVEGLRIGVGAQDSRLGLTLAPGGRVDLVTGDVTVSLEADSRWIIGGPAPGLFVGLIAQAAPHDFAPALSCNGIGIRLSRSSAPLIDAGVSLGSVAVHLFAAVSGAAGGTQVSGGAQIQLTDLAVAVGGATGGNPVGQGLLAGTRGEDALKPAFSPALAVQKHHGDSVKVSVSAGEGDGPWWLSIQTAFGPLYVEQVGLGVTVEQDDLEEIVLLLDGRVSLFGLVAAVDDLSLGYTVAATPPTSPFDLSRWEVDLAGLAINADIGGVLLAGGLRKVETATSVEYLGMLIGRFGVYGLSVYGGYGEATVDGERFASFFAFGAVNGPIGGPPAFFVTGIGGGLGINRELVFPTDLSTFGEFPFIKALDPGATPSDDPMAELESLRAVFPMASGEFWFAAGISFNSFALVDGVAVVSVAVGGGLEIALLGLARMALPRPQVALVSIELGLVARFSTEEGVLWVQAQLTDNSWLLHESVRLTGGFAFVTWFDGPHAGEFVLTLGGYHPSFHRDHYPQVPRLGFRWSVSDAIVVKGENYFALTSEALMAGGRLEASAEFGPAWAKVVFGADGIVYFDPFRFRVDVYASISAGITIDVWIGEITISIHIGARITVEGPKFRGTATFEVGPVELTVSFGDRTKAEPVYLPWPDFVVKYLEDAGGGVARVLTAVPGKGALPPGPGGDGRDRPTADGSAERPFEVLAEFELTVTTTVPTTRFFYGDAPAVPVGADHALGVAPVNAPNLASTLRLRLDAVDIERPGGADPADDPDWIQRLNPVALPTGRFPLGVWGPPGEDDNKKVPKGEVVTAAEGVHLRAEASLLHELPAEVPYHRVEINREDPRHPLPLKSEDAARAALLAGAAPLAAAVPDGLEDAAVLATARQWLSRGPAGGTTLSSYAGERIAVPRLTTLTETLADAPLPAPDVAPPVRRPPSPPDLTIHPPRVLALLTAAPSAERSVPRTTVSAEDAAEAHPVRPPTLARVEAEADPAVAARLVRAPTSSLAAGRGVRVPLTRSYNAATAAVAGRGRDRSGHRRIAELTGALASGEVPELGPGQITVLEMPNARRDVDPAAPRPRLETAGAPARVLALGFGGETLADTIRGETLADTTRGETFADTTRGETLADTTRGETEIPQGTERVVVVNAGADAPGLAGWHSGQRLAYVGRGTALVAGGVLRVPGGGVTTGRHRARAGWVEAPELTHAAPVVETDFEEPVRVVVVALDRVDADGEPVLDLLVSGAARVGDSPTAVVAGTRTYLVYAVEPEGGAAVTVTVAHLEGWTLGGVLGSAAADPGDVTARLRRHGLDTVVRPATGGRPAAGERLLRMRWSDGAPPPEQRAAEV